MRRPRRMKNNKMGCFLNGKFFLPIILLISSLLLISSVVAYFSDFMQKNINTISGTLDLVSEEGIQIWVNGNKVDSATFRHLYPGDVIAITGSFENEGNKSAWLRAVIDFSSNEPAKLDNMDHIKIYNGKYDSLSELESDTTKSEVTINENKIIGETVLIEGSGTNRRT